MQIMGAKQPLGWTMTKLPVTFIYIYSECIYFCVWVSDVNAFHWLTHAGPQFSSSWTEMCSNSSSIVNVANETILRQVHHRAKMTLVTDGVDSKLLWYGIFCLEQVCAGSEKVSRIESNHKFTTYHCQQTCNVHSAQNVVVGEIP